MVTLSIINFSAMGLRSYQEVETFLVQQLQKNIEDLGKGLGKNTDDATCIMMGVLMRVLKMVYSNLYLYNISDKHEIHALSQCFGYGVLICINRIMEY